jgi:hypothetical protein
MAWFEMAVVTLTEAVLPCRDACTISGMVGWWTATVVGMIFAKEVYEVTRTVE